VKRLALVVLVVAFLVRPSSALANGLGVAAVQGLALLAAGVLVGGATAGVIKRFVLLRMASVPPVRRVAGSVALEALLLNLIFNSFPAFVDPRGSLIGPVLVGLALYLLLATALNVRWFFRGAMTSTHALRDIAIAASIATITPFFIVTATVVLRMLVRWLFDV
jgi:hypothetical protein